MTKGGFLKWKKNFFPQIPSYNYLDMGIKLYSTQQEKREGLFTPLFFFCCVFPSLYSLFEGESWKESSSLFHGLLSGLPPFSCSPFHLVLISDSIIFFHQCNYPTLLFRAAKRYFTIWPSDASAPFSLFTFPSFSPSLQPHWTLVSSQNTPWCFKTFSVPRPRNLFHLLTQNLSCFSFVAFSDPS